MLDGIGATEMLHIFITNRFDDHRPACTGRPVTGYEARIVDDAGRELPRGEVGRLAVRGPTGCRYMADERQRKYVQDGWNLTGDSFWQDEEGYFHFAARSDDMIISAGYNIAGPEVEAALLSHPAVLECAVIGAADEERGQIVEAHVVLSRPARRRRMALVKVLQDHVKSVIAPYKYPRRILFVDALPKTQTGKIQRFRLRRRSDRAHCRHAGFRRECDRTSHLGFFSRIMPISEKAAGVLQMARAAFPYVLAVALFGLGLYAVSRLLADVDLADVLAQVHATPTSTLILAALATLLGYLCLVGYDWSGLRYIGKPLPLPVTITGGLMAYAFGNTIGLSAVSGGAVRYRIYSGFGLDGYDVAAVSTFAAVSYGVAATVIGFAAVALYPDRMGSLSPMAPEALRWTAIALIFVTVLPLVFAGARKGSLTLGRFTLRAPSLPVLTGQALFSLGDICFAALTLYLLLPSGEIAFAPFLGIFAAATMAGILSHVPGGVGVFETVVLAALPATIPVETAAAALLLFRLIYFILPFVLALAVLALYEALFALRGTVGLKSGDKINRWLAATGSTLGAVSPMAPVVLSVMIFGSGLWMSFAALIPASTETSEALEKVFPLVLLEGGALMSSVLGAVLIVLALGCRTA